MADVLDQLGRPLPSWMQDLLAQAIAEPGTAVAALDKARREGPLPLALKMCSYCTGQFAVEGDVGGEQGGTSWFCYRHAGEDKDPDRYVRAAVPRG